MEDINDSEVYLNLALTNGEFSYRCVDEHLCGELTHG